MTIPRKCYKLKKHSLQRCVLWACSAAGSAFGSHPRGRGFESLQVHHTVRTRTQFFTRKGLGTFFVYRRFCDESTQSGKRARAGYHCDGGILPFVLRDQVRLVRTWSPPYMAHWGQSLHTCVPGRACTPLARCNILDFVPKSVC